MNIDKHYSHQTTFPLNTHLRFPLKDHHFLLPAECQTWKLAPSYYYFYEQDLEQLSTSEWKDLYFSLNNSIDELNLHENVLRELTNVFVDTTTTTNDNTNNEILFHPYFLHENPCVQVFQSDDPSIICIWIHEKISANGHYDEEETWKQLVTFIRECSKLSTPVAIIIPHDKIHYMSARMLFTVQLFYQRFRMIKLLSTPQLSNVDRCFLLYNHRMHPITFPDVELEQELQHFDYLIPPSNDFLVKLEFTFYQMVANECYLNEQVFSILLTSSASSTPINEKEEIEMEFARKTRYWIQNRLNKWEKIKAETRPIKILGDS